MQDKSLVFAVVGGIVTGVLLIAAFTLFFDRSGSSLAGVPTQVEVSQQQAIDIAKYDIDSKYIQNASSYLIYNITFQQQSQYIPLREFEGGGWQVPLIYNFANGTTYGINARTHEVVKCGSFHPGETVCISPSASTREKIQGKLTWAIDLSVGCPDAQKTHQFYPFFYVIDAIDGRIVWKSADYAPQVACS